MEVNILALQSPDGCMSRLAGARAQFSRLYKKKQRNSLWNSAAKVFITL